MELQEIIIGIIVNSGNAKSKAMEAIKHAKTLDFDAADDCLEAATVELGKAHKIQTTLIQEEAGGTNHEISLLMVHAQDHLMTSLTTKDLAKEFVNLYKKMEENIMEVNGK